MFLGCLYFLFASVTGCQKAVLFERHSEMGYFQSPILNVTSTSKFRCAALCLEDLSCSAIAMRQLTPNLSTKDSGYRVTCTGSDKGGGFVSDIDWISYILTDGTRTCTSSEIFTTVSQTSTSAPKTCPSDFETLDDGCYKYHTEKKTWNEAKTLCESENGHLVTITSLTEQNRVSVRAFGIRGDMSVTFYAGGHDSASEGIWEWSSGEPFAFSYWKNDAPAGGTAHNCLLAAVYPGKWSAENCANKHEFICEIDITQ